MKKYRAIMELDIDEERSKNKLLILSDLKSTKEVVR